jgi:methylated-DNA-[protein]-cysteine S-methyltransferase
MTTIGWTTFETPLGWGGLAWSDAGITGIHLPELDRARVRAQLRRRFPSATETSPPPAIDEATATMTALVSGERVDLATVELDQTGVDDFDQQVYTVARRIPVGETLTYGQVAAKLGDPHLAREVGQALGRNPFPLVVPCHRVIAANGRLGGFSARGGVTTKQRLLQIEQANVSWQLPLTMECSR